MGNFGCHFLEWEMLEMEDSGNGRFWEWKILEVMNVNKVLINGRHMPPEP